jgi:hypothetical protein
LSANDPMNCLRSLRQVEVVSVVAYVERGISMIRYSKQEEERTKGVAEEGTYTVGTFFWVNPSMGRGIPPMPKMDATLNASNQGGEKGKGSVRTANVGTTRTYRPLTSVLIKSKTPRGIMSKLAVAP